MFMKKLLILLFCSFVFFGCSSRPNNSLKGIPVIDTHIHLYDTSRPEGVPWPPPSLPVLYKPHMPKQFAPVARANGITHTVVVEASDRYSDNKWLLDATADDKDHYLGIVGNIAVGSPDFGKQLAEACKDKRFVGIRIRPNAKYPYFTPKFWEDLKTLSKAGKTLDVLMKGITLPHVVEIARRNPDLKIIINHLTGIDLSQKGVLNAIWRQDVKHLASYPNVYMKLSGFLQRSGKIPAPDELSYYLPCLDILVGHFGEDRVVYGSNWPVTNKSGDYAQFKLLVMEYCRLQGRRFAEKLLYKNAVKFYNLPEID